MVFATTSVYGAIKKELELRERESDIYAGYSVGSCECHGSTY